ncbi:MAG: ATP-binding cassette domain-containing protein [Actinobacteria bacterium]|nr:MAG: ATP-binding cassette domain-containing protein [Actinomycetota bacterium]
MTMQLRALIALVLEQRSLYAVGSTFVAIGLVAALSYPILVKRLIDEGVLAGRMSRVNELALLLLVLLAVEGIATVIRDYYFNLASERLTARLRRRVFDHLLRQEIGFFDSRSVGELTIRLADDVIVIGRVVGEPFGAAVRFALLGVLGTVLLVYTSPTLTLLLMLAVPPIAVAAWVLGGRVKTLSVRTQQAYAEAATVAEESLGGIRTVRAFSQEPAAGARYHEKLLVAVESARQAILANSAQNGVSFVVGETAALLGLWAGASLILQGRLTSGAVISFVLYGLLVARGLRRASEFWGETVRGLGATQWIFETLAREPRMPVEGGVRLARVEGAVTLDGVRFRYPTRPDVEALTGIDLHIGPGEVMALVGRSGAGKSTILHLLLRFYDPDEGRISIDGHDTRALDAAWLRSQIGVVLQEPTLFSGTIADNIRYGLDGRSDAEVAAAAELACAREFIERFPAGFTTQIGSRGVQLSGGQRQRLAIARAVLRRPRILVLDEATNALDSESEAFVHQALRALDYGPTTFIIAHRLSTVINIDRVVVLDRGRITGSGRHDELVKTSPVYRQLIETQLALP